MVTKLLIALGIGFVYSFMSVTTMITGTSAIVHRGVRGGLFAGAGAALGFSIYAGLAILGLGMMTRFLEPSHLAVLEIVLAVLFVGTGLFLLVHKRHVRDRTKARTAVRHPGLWPYFVANLSLVLSGPQKIAYLAGLFLFFNLHKSTLETKALVPVAVLCGSLLAWTLYSLTATSMRRRLRGTRFVRDNFERLTNIYHWKVFVRVRRVLIRKQLVDRFLRAIPVLLFIVGGLLAVKGILFFTFPKSPL